MRRAVLIGLLASVALTPGRPAAVGTPALPAQLHQTGLHAPGEPERLNPRVIAFTPQHVLWSDGADKRRWIALPPGAAIDARDADAWRFPAGTRLWKEFAHDGRPVETRFMQLGGDGRWSFASYVWAADGRSATLAPERGTRLAVPAAPQGSYPIPSRADCLNCHAGARTPVLGFGALQLGPLVPELMRRGLLRHAPRSWRQTPPAIAAHNESERAARGYLHANCGHCHHAQGVPVPLVLAQDVAGTAAPSAQSLAVALRRMATREPLTQMPPLGTQRPDPQGQALVRAWLHSIDAPRSQATLKEDTP